jgi:hypothetical protein
MSNTSSYSQSAWVHRLGDHDITELHIALNQHLGGHPAATVGDGGDGRIAGRSILASNARSVLSPPGAASQSFLTT